MKLAKISFYGFLALIISLLLILSFVNASKAQSDTAVRSELISLRNRVERLESQVRGITIRGENAAPIPRRRSGTGIVKGEVVGETDPLFQRLATLVIELKEDLKKLEQRVQILEKETVSQKS
jgi:polyhydroxyalkanoate synthesis regulator phasin